SLLPMSEAQKRRKFARKAAAPPKQTPDPGPPALAPPDVVASPEAVPSRMTEALSNLTIRAKTAAASVRRMTNAAIVKANRAILPVQRLILNFDPPAEEAPKSRIAEDVVFGVCALAMTAAVIFYLAFATRPMVYDEVVLYNPIYMYLHTGVMTYPAHHHFDDMTVHPPPHYLVIAWLMRLGFSLYHAAAVLPSLLFLVLCILLLRSSFALHLRVSIAAGVFLSAFVWNYTYTIRPDMDMALAWMTG